MSRPYEQGNPDSKLIVLGEAPARTEIRMRQPFCGPSGHILDQAFSQNKLRRHRTYVLNVWENLVWKNAAGDFFDSSDNEMLWHHTRGFTRSGLHRAQNTVERINNSSANCILALGQQALALAAGIPEKISKWRGSILKAVPELPGKKVVASYHPAFILRGNYVSRYVLSQDLARAWEEAQTPDYSIPQRKHRLAPSQSEVLAYMRKCREAGRFATDLEVVNHQVHCFSLCFDPSETMVVPFVDEAKDHYWSLGAEVEIWREYADLMGDPAVTKVNQNIIGFDAPFLLSQNNIHTRGLLHDTMVAQHILYPELPKGLDFLCSVYTREPYYKDEGKMWKNEGGSLEQFWTYCGKDAATALEAWDVLEKELRDTGYWHTYEMTAGLAQPLMYMYARGLKIDYGELRKAQVKAQEELEVCKAELAELAGPDFNPLSPLQCKKYFYETKGCKPYTGPNGITCDDKALSRIYRATHLREAKLVQEIRALSKLKSTYLDVEADKDGRLRCSWNPRGTWTGRLSSSQTLFGTGMNLQNLHPKFKDFIVADED